MDLVHTAILVHLKRSSHLRLDLHGYLFPSVLLSKCCIEFYFPCECHISTDLITLIAILVSGAECKVWTSSSCNCLQAPITSSLILLRFQSNAHQEQRLNHAPMHMPQSCSSIHKWLMLTLSGTLNKLHGTVTLNWMTTFSANVLKI
jgi:hypothetical protein